MTSTRADASRRRSFGNDEARLNRLAKADVIGDEHAPRAMQERECRLELMGEDGDVGVDDAGERPHAIRAPDRVAASRAIACWGRTRFSRSDRLIVPGRSNGDRNVSLAVAVCDVETDDVTIAADALDAPALLSNPDEVPR